MSAHPIIAELRKIRQEGRISQDAIAVAIGHVCPTIISRLEHGVNTPMLTTLSKWANALGYELVLRPKEP